MRRGKVAAELFQPAQGLAVGGVMWTIVRYLSGLVRFLGVPSAAAFGLALLAWPAFADVPDDKRVALVIGNGAYENAPKLDNAAFDAKAVADAFRKLGFEVVDGYDLGIAEMRAKVSDFAAVLPDAESAVIYYAGHGISVDEENYLIPTDIVLKNPTDLDLGSISVSLLLKQMKREERVNIVVLDACRDNPFASALASAKTRAIVGEQGLSRIDGDLARGTLIAFASDPKSTALDGPPGHHSPFTEAFLAHVFDPGVSIDTVMSRVRAEVWEKTRHKQLPWVNTSLIGEYELNPQPSSERAAEAAKVEPAATASGGDRQSQEDLLWESAQHSNLSADYQAYLDAFPNGVFTEMAKNRIANLQAAGAPVAAQPPERIATAEPAAPSQKDWKAEIGTEDTEKALDLTPADQREIQQRLTALGIYRGPTTGALDPRTRSALADWQKTRGAAPTSFLGPMQLAALRAESESAYQKDLAQAVKQPAKPATRAAKKPAKAAARPSEPARHVVKRPPRPPVSAAANAAHAIPAPTPSCNGNPQWCRAAGLPVNSGAPEPGRPPGF